MENGVVRLNGKLSATVRPRLDPASYAPTSQPHPRRGPGLPGTLPGAAGAEVDLWPGWLGRLPGWGQRDLGRFADPGTPAPTAHVGPGFARYAGWRSAPNGP